MPAGLYNLLAIIMLFGASAPDGPSVFINQAILDLPMLATHAHWQISTGDLLLAFSLICLFFEIIGSSKSSNDIILNHVLSMFLLIACLIEFLLFRPFATSTFFLLTAMPLLDVLAGFVITTAAARKDIGFGG